MRVRCVTTHPRYDARQGGGLRFESEGAGNRHIRATKTNDSESIPVWGQFVRCSRRGTGACARTDCAILVNATYPFATLYDQ